MKIFILFFWLLASQVLHAQNDRVSDYNNTNWLQSFNTISLNKKWSLHAEYQMRRTDGLKYTQQSLIRAGVNYKINDQVTLHSGYGWIETFAYGDYPIAANGRFPEHRLYEQVSLRQPLNKLLVTHRFRVEQRWLGRVAPGTEEERKIEGWSFLHRFRYQVRLQYPITKPREQQLYVATANELFVSAGKNVGVNLFDQNRFFILLGAKLCKQLSIEGGYFNQTLQQGRRVNSNTIMQRNNGLLIASYLNL